VAGGWARSSFLAGAPAPRWLLPDRLAIRWEAMIGWHLSASMCPAL
jgi:hypothetical protein